MVRLPSPPPKAAGGPFPSATALPSRPTLNGTKSRSVNRTIPGIAGLMSPEILQREAKNELNRSKVESQKIDSESPSESHPIDARSDLGIAQF